MQNVIKKYGYYISLAIGIITALIFGVGVFNKDNVIINSGIGTYKILSVLAYVLLVSTIALLILTMKIQISSKFQAIRDVEHDKEARKNPLYDEPAVRSKLENIQNEVDNLSYVPYAKAILRQMDNIQSLQDDFAEIVESNDQPIIQNIANELVSIRIHILQDAKSIYRRLVIAKDSQTIDAKLEHNEQLLADADDLIVEAINYIDVKTESTDVDLNNLTESLKELITMI